LGVYNVVTRFLGDTVHNSSGHWYVVETCPLSVWLGSTRESSDLVGCLTKLVSSR